MRAVVFDTDGTIVDSAPAFADRLNAALARWGLPARTESQVRAFVIQPVRQWLPGLMEGVPEAERAAFRRALSTHERSALERCARLYDGVEELLGRLQASGWDLYITSRGTRSYVSDVVEVFGLSQYFRQVHGRDTYPGKEDLLAHLLEENELATLALVGDQRVDQAAAQAAGVPFVHAAYGYDPSPLTADAFRAMTPSDVYGILERLLRDVDLSSLRDTTPNRPAR
jgi:phosphoglycolate phosphatase